MSPAALSKNRKRKREGSAVASCDGPGESEELFPKDLSAPRLNSALSQSCAVCLTVTTEDDDLDRGAARKQRYVCVPSGCQHAFHANCLEQWVRRSPACPVCRAEIAKYATYNKKGRRIGQVITPKPKKRRAPQGDNEDAAQIFSEPPNLPLALSRILYDRFGPGSVQVLGSDAANAVDVEALDEPQQLLHRMLQDLQIQGMVPLPLQEGQGSMLAAQLTSRLRGRGRGMLGQEGSSPSRPIDLSEPTPAASQAGTPTTGRVLRSTRARRARRTP